MSSPFKCEERPIPRNASKLANAIVRILLHKEVTELQIMRKMVPLDDCLDLFPALSSRLHEINRALRNINFGKMDYLPYEEAVPGYDLSMRTDLIPQGAGKPPSMGHWQLEVSRQDAECILVLQGKAQNDQELAEIVYPCGPNLESQRFFPAADDTLD